LAFDKEWMVHGLIRFQFLTGPGAVPNGPKRGQRGKRQKQEESVVKLRKATHLIKSGSEM